MLGQTFIQSGLASFLAGATYGIVVSVALSAITLLFNKFNHQAPVTIENHQAK